QRMNDIVAVKVWGEYALFTRPELKVERLSYQIMTPSAARGILDAILYRPQMEWYVRRITAIRPIFPDGYPKTDQDRHYRMINVRRNEIQGKVPTRTVEGWMKDPRSTVPYLVDSAGREGAQGQNRTQRNSQILHHVAYVIHASPVLTERANRPRARPADEEEGTGPDSVSKYVSMFERRVRKGQCFHHPYLGCREFACHFAPVDGSEQPLAGWNERLGFMLYDLRFRPGKAAQPGFFDAEIRQGGLHCDRQSRGPNGEAPVEVHGWDEGGQS
ncbi:MAG: type I-C CRISPR-associated protein Cas5c, partial [Isosphaeraceae bacterium]